jgi:hypothetical protein
VPDKQIHPIGVEPAPADYKIPDSVELLLKGAYASFDGSGAGGSFVPLLRIISDAGSTSLEAPADVTIAAGASADVSWFPRVAAAAASSGGATLQDKAAIYSSPTVYTLVPGVPKRIEWQLNAGVALLDLTDTFNPQIITAGLYCFSIAYAGSGFPTGAALEGELTFVTGTSLGVGTSVPRGSNTADHYGLTTMTRYLAAGAEIHLDLTNQDTVNHNGFIHEGFVSLLAA